jgi:hypothetical protein
MVGRSFWPIWAQGPGAWEYRLEGDGTENENTRYKSNPSWHKVRPSPTALYLSIMKVNSRRDELTSELGCNLADALFVLRQDMPRNQGHWMLNFRPDTKELGVSSCHLTPRASGFGLALQFFFKATVTAIHVLVESQHLNEGEHIAEPAWIQVLLVLRRPSVPHG